MNKNGTVGSTSAGKSSYKVQIRPDTTRFKGHGIERAISVGMSVQADINTDKRKLIEFLLSPVIKYVDEGLKVR